MRVPTLSKPEPVREPQAGASRAALAFRESMSRVAGAVHIIATDGPAGRAGLTATAVTSVSDSPPSLIVCLNAASRTAGILKANGVFSVNVLAAAHEDVARHFAHSGLSMAERFAHGAWEPGPGGVPWLAGALARLAMRIEDIRPVGSHCVVIGAVIAAEAGADAEPLLYHARDYRVLHHEDRA